MDKIDIQSLIKSDLSDASYLMLIHERIQKFRWVVILEFIFCLVFLICILPFILILIIIMIFSDNADLMFWDGDDAGLLRKLGFKGLYANLHQYRLQVFNAENQVIDDVTWIPDNRKQAESVIIDLLDSINEKQLVLVQSLGGDMREHMGNWYGGKPLLAIIPKHCEQDAIEALNQKDFTINVREKETELSFTETHDHRWAKVAMFVIIAVLVFFFPYILLGLFIKDVREFLKESFFTVRGITESSWHLIVKAEQIRLYRKRGNKEIGFININGRDILGMSFAASYGFDQEVKYHQKELNVYSRDQIYTFPDWVNENGHIILPFILSTTLRLRAEQPELGLNFDKDRPSKCPYCASIYVFEAGKNCPSCGGWPDKCF